jgi:DNA phosphorothioation-associated putative methyltransferase
MNEIKRHKAALKRSDLSRPLKLAIQDNLIGASDSVFDYGCGHGSDVQILSDRGLKIRGWDPFYFSENPIVAASIVNLGFVLNVIENSAERRTTLGRSFELASKCLIVSVRTKNELLEGIHEYEDGVFTNFGTFQKLYDHNEISSFIQEVLGRSPYLAAPGIYYVFKNDDYRDQFIVERELNLQKIRNELGLKKIKNLESIDGLVLAFEQLGRLPFVSEFPAIYTFINEAGGIGKLESLLLQTCNYDNFRLSKEANMNDIAVAFISLCLDKKCMPNSKLIAVDLLSKVTSYWSTKSEFIEKCTAVLKNLANEDLINELVISAGIGKKMPRHLYIHKSAVETLPAELRMIIKLGESLTGKLDSEIIKIKRTGKTVSFLFYENFDKVAHPRLLLSVKADLQLRTTFFKDFRNAENKPLLHRKELLVSENYPKRALFQKLTLEEEKNDLLSDEFIGFEKQWNALLTTKKLKVVGHSVKKNK